MIRPMTQQEYQSFSARSIRSYAEERKQAEHLSQKEAMRLATDEFSGMLPKGLATPGNTLLTMTDEGDQRVGHIWYLFEEYKEEKQAFISEIVVEEAFRRQGYATEALTHMEEHAREAGCDACVLYVNDQNVAAQALYRRLGYAADRKLGAGQYMKKKL